MNQMYSTKKTLRWLVYVRIFGKKNHLRCLESGFYRGCRQRYHTTLLLHIRISQPWRFLFSQAAKLLGQKLGGELAVAAKEAHKIGSILILGDRFYGVTIQRAFDCLTFFEKCKVGIMMMWEILTMSLFKVKNYVTKSETEDDFIGNQITQLGIMPFMHNYMCIFNIILRLTVHMYLYFMCMRKGKYLPSLVEVLIKERDEYISQTLLEVASQMESRAYGKGGRSCSILAVVGAGKYMQQI